MKQKRQPSGTLMTVFSLHPESKAGLHAEKILREREVPFSHPDRSLARVAAKQQSDRDFLKFWGNQNVPPSKQKRFDSLLAKTTS